MNIGALIGDINGSIYEFNNYRKEDFELFQKSMFFTDDSVLTFAIDEICESNDFSKENIVKTLKRWSNLYPDSGYGFRYRKWISSNDIEPYNSFGNGSAMRISPVAWHFDTIEEVVKHAIEVTEVTHNHPEGIKGAVVTASIIFYLRMKKDKKFIEEYALKEYPIIKSFELNSLRKTYKFNETCQDTVPQAIYCFLISNSFEDCLRKCISIGGDSDTIGAIVMPMAEAYYGIPDGYYEKTLSYLDERLKTYITEKNK